MVPRLWYLPPHKDALPVRANVLDVYWAQRNMVTSTSQKREFLALTQRCGAPLRPWTAMGR